MALGVRCLGRGGGGGGGGCQVSGIDEGIGGGGGGKGVGAKSKGQKLNQTGSANAERSGKSLPRAVSICVASEVTDAQYLAEVAQTNAVLANFKRRRRERHSKSCQVGVKSVRRDDSL